MTQIMELMDKRAKAWEAAKAFLNSHSQNGGMVSAEDAATYDKMEKEVTDLTKDIERLQRQEQIDKMMSAPTSTPLTGKPGVKDEPEDKPGRASAAYKKAFWDNIRHPGNPAIRDVLEEGTDANGGYLVPIEFEHTLVQALNENNIMRTIGCKVITTQNERKIPVANGHTQAAWTAENGAYTESNPTFAQTSIDAFKLTDLIKVSDELLSDSFFDIEGYISEEFGRAFGEAEEDAFINGAVQTGQTAIDRPTGLFIPSAAGGAPSGVTAASATAITADELISLVYSLKAPYRSKAKFLMNTMKSGISNGFNAIKSTVSNIVNGIKSTISNVFNTIWSTVSGIVNKLKSVFNFSWSLPKIKLPHFSITGSFSLNPPSIPHFSVDWYKKAMSGGMILKDATIFGQSGGTLLGGGEAGDEAVVGVSSLRSMIQDAVQGAALSLSGDQPLINIQEMSVRSDDDIRKISQQLNTLLNAGRRAKGYI